MSTIFSYSPHRSADMECDERKYHLTAHISVLWLLFLINVCLYQEKKHMQHHKTSASNSILSCISYYADLCPSITASNLCDRLEQPAHRLPLVEASFLFRHSARVVVMKPVLLAMDQSPS
jgi:hypothetical protein